MVESKKTLSLKYNQSKRSTLSLGHKQRKALNFSPLEDSNENLNV